MDFASSIWMVYTVKPVFNDISWEPWKKCHHRQGAGFDTNGCPPAPGRYLLGPGRYLCPNTCPTWQVTFKASFVKLKTWFNEMLVFVAWKSATPSGSAIEALPIIVHAPYLTWLIRKQPRLSRMYTYEYSTCAINSDATSDGGSRVVSCV